MLTENFMIKEAMTYEQLATDESFNFTKEKREIFENNAEYYRSAVKRYKEIIKKIGPSE